MALAGQPHEKRPRARRAALRPGDRDHQRGDGGENCRRQNESCDGPAIPPCGDGSLSPVAVARTILRANETSKERPLGRFGIAPWSAHDLRRTALTGMARLGVAPIVLGHVANHRTTTRAGVTLAVYSQYTYDKEKRAALDLWASRLVAICGGTAASVTPLRRGKGARRGN